MSKKKHYDINTIEEFIDAWKKIAPRLFERAKELNISLENADGTPMDASVLFLTGETTTEKLKQAGVDVRTAERMLQLADAIREYRAQLLTTSAPTVTPERIKEAFEQQHKEEHVRNELEQSWIVLASLAWPGYKRDGRGFLYMNELPPKWMRYCSGDMPPLGGVSKELRLWAQELEKSTRDYDPEKEIVVALWHDDGVYTFRLRQEPPPPKAYELRRHVLERK